MKKLLALLLALVILPLALCGCASLEGRPDGTRPDTLDGNKLLPSFASRSAVVPELNYQITRIEEAEDIDAQRAAYQDFLHAGFVYVLGDYGIASFIADDGGNLALYQQEITNLLNDFLVTSDQRAWTAIREKEWGSVLVQEFSAGASTPTKIRSSYPTTTDNGQELTQAIFNSRQDIYEALQEDKPDEELAALMQEALVLRRDIAEQMGYDSYLSFCFQNRDNIPYTPEDVLKLAQLVRDKLCPVLAAAAPAASLPQALDSEGWQQALPELIARLPAPYRDDLSYCLDHNLLTVVPVAEDGKAERYSYMLYQYDASFGRARVAGEFADLPIVTGLLGAMARDMVIPSQQWAVSTAQLSDCTQVSAFQQLIKGELSAVYGENAAVQHEYDRLLLEDICRAAMRYELLYRFYEMETVTASAVNDLAAELSTAYGLPLTAREVYALEPMMMGTAYYAPQLLGGLAGVQVGILGDEDPEAAQALYEVMLSVYNYGSPVNEAVKAGLANPYSAESLDAAAAWYADKLA